MEIIKKILFVLRTFVLFVWQLPQTLIGALSLIIFEPTHILLAKNRVRVCYSKRLKGGSYSLGQVVVMPIWYYRHDATDALELATAKHEYLGHGRQSLVLGWFYLFVIAVPSLIHAAIHGRNAKCEGKPYNHFYTEKWAEKWAK